MEEDCVGRSKGACQGGSEAAIYDLHEGARVHAISRTGPREGEGGGGAEAECRRGAVGQMRAAEPHLGRAGRRERWPDGGIRQALFHVKQGQVRGR
jgi:hypothetical protein